MSLMFCSSRSVRLFTSLVIQPREWKGMCYTDMFSRLVFQPSNHPFPISSNERQKRYYPFMISGHVTLLMPESLFTCQNGDCLLWKRWAFFLWPDFNIQWLFTPPLLNVTGPHFALPETNNWEFQADWRWTVSRKAWPWTSNFQGHKFFPSGSLNITYDFSLLNIITELLFQNRPMVHPVHPHNPNTNQHWMLQEGIKK